jgi:hypothetical protein
MTPGHIAETLEVGIHSVRLHSPRYGLIDFDRNRAATSLLGVN